LIHYSEHFHCKRKSLPEMSVAANWAGERDVAGGNCLE
jgi:hypothetical protein